jgi:hypothetical protein
MAIPGPVIVDFIIKPDENVYPMIPAGQSIHEMLEEPVTADLPVARTEPALSSLASLRTDSIEGKVS